jgi:nucleoside-diphosphate-sugar epimerase
MGGYVLRALLAAGHGVTNDSRTQQLSTEARFTPGDILDLDALKLACLGARYCDSSGSGARSRASFTGAAPPRAHRRTNTA